MPNKKTLPGVGDREGRKEHSNGSSNVEADINRPPFKRKRRSEREEDFARERNAKRARSRTPIGRLRLDNLAQLIKRRYGGLPDTDDVVIFIQLAAQHLDHVKDREFSLVEWCRLAGGHQPDLSTIRAVCRHAELHPKRYRADELAKVLKLKINQRDAWELWTIIALRTA